MPRNPPVPVGADHTPPTAIQKRRGPSAALSAAIEANKRPLEPNKLEKLQEMVGEARVLDVRIVKGNILLTELKSNLGELKNHRIPDYMNEIGVSSIALDAVGKPGQKNYIPAYECERTPFYSANISVDWPEEIREGSFDYLAEIGHDDLIKNTVTHAFPRGTSQETITRFCKMVSQLKVMVLQEEQKINKNGELIFKTVDAGEVKGGRRLNVKIPVMVKKKVPLEIPPAEVGRGVNPKTLTAWLKNQVEHHNFTPDLAKIGGMVGTVAKLKEVKVKKAAIS